jgi:site-specific DNA-methyltransferase (adenine-specific)
MPAKPSSLEALRTLSIEEAAREVQVSLATIRNWIKTGYLKTADSGEVYQQSWEVFKQNILGKEKLHFGANKLFKETTKIQAKRPLIAHWSPNSQGEELGINYQNSLSDSHKNREGIYYTPSWIVSDMFDPIKIRPENIFLDPCCGSGNFIMEALRRGIAPENVYAVDTDIQAIKITKERVKKTFGCELPNVFHADFLEILHLLKQKVSSFDLILTNPPWGKKMDKKVKETYSRQFGCGKSLDSTSLFMGACLSVLKPGGHLSFLMQEAFFNIASFEDIRSQVFEKKIDRLVDYGKVFPGLLTKAQAITLVNQPASDLDKIECHYQNQTYRRSRKSFKNNPKRIFNFWTNSAEAAVIEQLFSVPHTTLKGKAQWGMGIVTGNNQKYCSSSYQPGYIPVYRGSDITPVGFKKPGVYIPEDFSKYQQVAPLERYQAKEKLVYKFITSRLCFCYDDQQQFILNSANLLIPKDLGITAIQLRDLLNSEIINWLYNKLFASHKVLRSDLESLPIHVDYFKKQAKFDEESYLRYLKISRQAGKYTCWV